MNRTLPNPIVTSRDRNITMRFPLSDPASGAYKAVDVSVSHFKGRKIMRVTAYAVEVEVGPFGTTTHYASLMDGVSLGDVATPRYSAKALAALAESTLAALPDRIANSPRLTGMFTP